MISLKQQLLNEYLSLQEAELLLPSLGVLPSGRVRSVLNARVQWIASGLTAEAATNRAVSLSKKLSVKRLEALKASRGTLLSKAAERHEAAIKGVFLQAVQAGLAALPESTLEHTVAHGVPGHLVDKVISEMRKVLSGVSAS